MKKSIYINKNNQEHVLKELAKGKELSTIVNEALEQRYNTVSFDNWELRSKVNYKLVLFRFPCGLVELLQRLKENYKSAKVVCYTAMTLLVQYYDRQARERPRRFPRKHEMGMDYINHAIEQLLKR